MHVCTFGFLYSGGPVAKANTTASTTNKKITLAKHRPSSFAAGKKIKISTFLGNSFFISVHMCGLFGRLDTFMLKNYVCLRIMYTFRLLYRATVIHKCLSDGVGGAGQLFPFVDVACNNSRQTLHVLFPPGWRSAGCWLHS